MTQFQYPLYFIVGDRPVTLQKTEDGGLTCLAFDWKTRKLERNMNYYMKVSNMEGEVDEVDEGINEIKSQQTRLLPTRY